MKNITILVLMGIMILVIGSFVFVSSGKTNGDGNTITGNVVANGNVVNGEMQKITLSTKNYNYYPSEIKVKANQPVELTLDENVYGCLRSFTIRDLGVSKRSKSPEDKIVFTPTKKGTFTFACSMGMGYGKIIVE